MAREFQNHFLKDDETLRVPPPLPHSLYFSDQHPHEAPPHLAPKTGVPPSWNQCEILPPHLPCCVVRYPIADVPTIAGVHPVYVDVV